MIISALDRSPFLWIGVTNACFQTSGIDEDLSDLLNRIVNGTCNSWAVSFKAKTGQPSGPGDLSGFKFISLVYTVDGDIVIVSKTGTDLFRWNDGIELVSSWVNTLVKIH